MERQEDFRIKLQHTNDLWTFVFSWQKETAKRRFKPLNFLLEHQQGFGVQGVVNIFHFLVPFNSKAPSILADRSRKSTAFPFSESQSMRFHETEINDQFSLSFKSQIE